MKMRPKIFRMFLIFSLLPLLLVTVQESFSAGTTQPVEIGINTFEFRDIENIEACPEFNPLEDITFDNIENNKGGTGMVWIDDCNSNINNSTIDFVSGEVIQPSSLTTVIATDSVISPGEFHGDFPVTDNFESLRITNDTEANEDAFFTYEPGKPEYARGSVTIDAASSGTITLSDVEFTDDDFINLCFRPVIHSVNLGLEDGATLTSTDTSVTLSYANGVFLEDDKPANLQMYYKKPGSNWKLLTPNTAVDAIVNPNDPFANDFIAKTITSDPAESSFSSQVTTGLFTLGYETGCGGGGGGGLVRPSLVVNALAGIGGAGGGGSAYSSPQLNLGNIVLLDWIEVPTEVEEQVVNHDSTSNSFAYDLGYFQDFDYPLIINDKGFILSGFTTTLETQTLQTNTPHTIKFLYYENEIIQHFSLYTNLRDANDEIHESDTQILYNANQELQVVDPNGFFENVTLTVNELDDNKKEVVLELTFAKTMDTSHIIVRSWDPNLYSGDNHILNAWEIVSDVVIESPIPTYEEPEIQQLQSQIIPIWIKNNAAWWSEQQISDNDFVEGIEYLIKNGIIDVPGVQVGDTTTSEIPDWIKNNAGWWAESLITDDDFIQAMQWLVANGVIQI
jgi:hypothetical protein